MALLFLDVPQRERKNIEPVENKPLILAQLLGLVPGLQGT